MTMTKQPASSFGPELLALLKSGAESRVEIPFAKGKDAIRLRHRIHQLRAAMRRDKHPDWEQVYRTQVLLEGPHIKPGVPDPNQPQVLVVSPRDSEFNEAIQRAGVKILEPTPLVLTPIPELQVDANDPAEAFLKTLNIVEEKK